MRISAKLSAVAHANAGALLTAHNAPTLVASFRKCVCANACKHTAIVRTRIVWIMRRAITGNATERDDVIRFSFLYIIRGYLSSTW